MANINRNELAKEQAEKAMGAAEAMADVELSEEELMQMVGGRPTGFGFSLPPFSVDKRTGP